MATKNESADNYSEDDVLKSPWMKWGAVGDSIHGTLISVKQRTSINQNTGKEEDGLVYEMKCDGGEFHDVDEKKNPIEPAIKILAGEIFNIGDHFTINPVMRNIKLGQKIKIAFTEEKPSKKKGNAPMKVRKVYSKGEMDEVWLKEQEDAKALTEM